MITSATIIRMGKIRCTYWWGIMFMVMLLSMGYTPSLFAQKSPLVVVYPRALSSNDQRDLELLELLKVALQKTEPSDGPYILQPSVLAMGEARYRDEIVSGNRINIIWAAVTEAMERTTIPIRIPVRKGILGYRLLLIHQEDQPKFAKLSTLEALRPLTVGLGSDWLDNEVFRDNGIHVVTGNNYEGLFRMLVKRRFDYFSRGLNEIFAEYKTFKPLLPDLAIEQHLALYYPWPKYFFVSKSYPQIADRIERGLNMMIDDGTFDAMFLKYHQSDIEAAGLGHRHLLLMRNPLLPKTVPLQRKELWYVPEKIEVDNILHRSVLPSELE